MTKKDVDDIYNNATATSMLCMPYIIGGRLQIERYLKAQKLMEFDHIGAAYRCLHEISALFEDLDMIRRYLEAFDTPLWDGKLKIKELRDAIRHDTRKELNSDNNEKRRQKRAASLQTKSEFLFSILFHENGVTVGDHRVSLNDVYHYLNSAERIVTAKSLGVNIVYSNSETEIKK